MKQLKRIVGALFASSLAVACGGSDVPARELADAEASIRAAQEVGAENTPDAALQLKMARDRLARAKDLKNEGEGEQAREALQQAELDAELAILLARKEDAQRRAREAQMRAKQPGQTGQAKSIDDASMEQMEHTEPQHEGDMQ